MLLPNKHLGELLMLKPRLSLPCWEAAYAISLPAAAFAVRAAPADTSPVEY